jgi:hypothetical protein
MKHPKPTRHRDHDYLNWIRTLDCMSCFLRGPSIAHHVSWVGGTGQGTKPNDLHVLPLCAICHQSLHAGEWGMGEEDRLYISKAIIKQLSMWIEIKGGQNE